MSARQRQLKRVYLYFADGSTLVLEQVIRVEKSTRRGSPVLAVVWPTGKKNKAERKYTYENLVKVTVVDVGVCSLCNQRIVKALV